MYLTAWCAIDVSVCSNLCLNFTLGYGTIRSVKSVLLAMKMWQGDASHLIIFTVTCNA